MHTLLDLLNLQILVWYFSALFEPVKLQIETLAANYKKQVFYLLLFGADQNRAKKVLLDRLNWRPGIPRASDLPSMLN